MSLWKVARVDVNTLPPEQCDEVKGWLEGFGVPTGRCIPWLVVTQDEDDQKYRAHVSVMGEPKVIDHAANRVHSNPLVVIVDSFPGWLAGLDHKEP